MIDWKKPLRNIATGAYEGQHEKAYTFKSGKQRVIWIGDRVYPVDERGRSVAEVRYPGCTRAFIGTQVVENVPEAPKDHLCIWLKGPDGVPNIDSFGGEQLHPRSKWEQQFKGRIGKDIILVKVPV